MGSYRKVNSREAKQQKVQDVQAAQISALEEEVALLRAAISISALMIEKPSATLDELESEAYQLAIDADSSELVDRLSLALESLWSDTDEDGATDVDTDVGSSEKNPTRIYHVTIGSDSWDPSPAEFDKIKELFAEALEDDDNYSIVVTRQGVNLSVHD